MPGLRATVPCGRDLSRRAGEKTCKGQAQSRVPGCLAPRAVLMEFRAKAQEELGEGFQVQEVEQNVQVRRGRAGVGSTGGSGETEGQRHSPQGQLVQREKREAATTRSALCRVRLCPRLGRA